MSILIILFLLSVSINLAMFFVAFYYKTDKLTDISYSLTFITLAVFGFFNSDKNFASVVLTAMICTWAIRLGLYLLNRIRKIGKDKRFDDKREKFWAFLAFWMLQGFTVWLVLLPSSLFYMNGSGKLTIISTIGVAIWFIGLLIETIADSQKYKFINDIKNKGKWIDTGLWKFSRHPNYFGEILLWFGVYIFTLSAFNTTESLVGLIGPLYISALIIFVSGIPLLEKAADKRWGNDENYKKYKKGTSILVLLPKIK